MINCEDCGVEVRAETHKPPIWGVHTFYGNRFKRYYFCSKQHGNGWIKKQTNSKLVLEKVIDESV